MSDLRNSLAKARDDFLKSFQGKACIDPTTLGVDPKQRRYLINRIELAFIAGWNAAKAEQEQQR